MKKITIYISPALNIYTPLEFCCSICRGDWFWKATRKKYYHKTWRRVIWLLQLYTISEWTKPRAQPFSGAMIQLNPIDPNQFTDRCYTMVASNPQHPRHVLHSILIAFVSIVIPLYSWKTVWMCCFQTTPCALSIECFSVVSTYM